MIHYKIYLHCVTNCRFHYLSYSVTISKRILPEYHIIALLVEEHL
jgi:hypothetical protein